MVPRVRWSGEEVRHDHRAANLNGCPSSPEKVDPTDSGRDVVVEAAPDQHSVLRANSIGQPIRRTVKDESRAPGNVEVVSARSGRRW